MADYRKERIERLDQDEIDRDELLRQRLIDPYKKKRFRNAYVFKVGVDYANLIPYCENIIVVVEGYAEHIDISRAKIELNMKDYDSDKDLVVSIGRSTDNLLVGMFIQEKIKQKPPATQSFAHAIFYNFSYKFYEVFLNPTIETVEIYVK